MFNKSITLLAGALLALPLSAALAGKPGGGTAPPPEVNLGYFTISGPAGIVTGLQVSPTGSAGSPVSLWKVEGLYENIAWDPSGTWLAWVQRIDRQANRGIVIGSPGGAPRNVLVFPSAGITHRNGFDGLAWGKGCNGNSVVVFVGDEKWAALDTLYVFDPFAANPQPKPLYTHAPAPNDAAPGHGAGLAFSPQGRHLAFLDYAADGVEYVVTLPLTCHAGDSLPSAAGPPQPLIPLRIDGVTSGSRALDWSPDGRRLVVTGGPLLVSIWGYHEWGYEHLAVGELEYLWDGVSEQVMPTGSTASSLRSITSGPAPGAAEYSDRFPTWAPSAADAACDRLAFVRQGVMYLLDVSRPGFGTADCAIPEPRSLNLKNVAATDWK
jgi:hypothetical protein